MFESENGTGEEKALSPMWEFLSEEFDYRRPKRGDILDAEVVRIDKDAIIVDVGAKSEGVIPSKDLQMLDEEVRASIEVGDRVSVYVLRPGSPDEDLIVSVNMARALEDWQEAERHLEEEKTYEGTVTGHNKGGLIVPFGQIRGFVPASQLVNLGGRPSPESRMEQLAQMEGEKLQLKVIEVDRNRRRLIFSQRAAMRRLREEQKEKLLEELQEGDIRTGKVSNLCDFGAFVDLGGADGLIHISELSWQRVKHPREVLNAGDEVEVYVLRVDRERKRIGLSLRRLQPDPWTLAGEKFYVGQIVKGTITNVVNFGVFARIDEGIEGLIHISELSDEPFDDPRKIVHEGDLLPLKILSIDTARQRIALSLKQAPTLEELEGREALVEMVQAEEAAPEEAPTLEEPMEEEETAPEEAPPPQVEEIAEEVEEEETAPEEAPTLEEPMEEEESAPEEKAQEEG
ncbi:MAG: S1 RNA-binding domain-containing protein [Anaerolineae bacterium]